MKLFGMMVMVFGYGCVQASALAPYNPLAAVPDFVVIGDSFFIGDLDALEASESAFAAMVRAAKAACRAPVPVVLPRRSSQIKARRVCVGNGAPSASKRQKPQPAAEPTPETVRRGARRARGQN